jgi:hypothetical protein
MINPIKDLYSLGMDLDCADKYVQRCYPRLTAWIRDTPEQSLLTSVISGFCPVCKVPKDCLEKQSSEWECRTVVNSRKRALTNDEARPNNESSKDDSVQEIQRFPSQSAYGQDLIDIRLLHLTFFISFTWVFSNTTLFHGRWNS